MSRSELDGPQCEQAQWGSMWEVVLRDIGSSWEFVQGKGDWGNNQDNQFVSTSGPPSSVRLSALLHSYDPLSGSVILCIIAILVCYFGSQITRNCSQVDRLWSILPPAYCWIYWWLGSQNGADSVRYGKGFGRTALMASLATAWGARLTFNFWRKGGYNAGEEDYRWPYCRKKYGWLKFELLNITFIAPGQNFLLLLLTLPAYLCMTHSTVSLNMWDWVVALAFCTTFGIELVADEQQWAFQSEKYRQKGLGLKLKGDYAAGFLRSGLFAYSRHPNFLCEILNWWIFTGFVWSGGVCGWDALAPTLGVVAMTFSGCFLLNLLFFQSTPLTEEITSAKYPLYKEYQQQVGRLVPWRYDQKGKKAKSS